MNNDKQIHKLFAGQVAEMVAGVEGFLRKGNSIGEEDLYEAYRLVHRCKGDAAMLALNDFAQAAEIMVAPLRLAHNQRRPLTEGERSLLKEGLATLG